MRVLLDDAPPSLRPAGTPLVTTGLWYHRLCRATATAGVQGALSARLGISATPVSAATVRVLIELPAEIGLVSLRDLGWPMARLLGEGVRLNLLSLEALAAAEHVGGILCLAETDPNEALLSAATERGTPTRVIRD